MKNKERDDNDLLSTEFAYFRYNIYEQCHKRSLAKPDGIKFMQWLKANHWRIVICTSRDLRKASHYTKEWLHANHIPWDHLFSAQNKIVFCKLWGIQHLVDDNNFNILHGGQYGISVYYPIMSHHQGLQSTAARGFTTFDEVKRWIQG
ncbi:MAG: hypothetical protein P4N59_02560 [Negativicutes bacterium]|nr:hypothetical protein [Negativicutes bacterium]